MKPLSKQSLLLILLGLLAIVTVGLFVMEKREEMPVVKTPPTPIEKDTENEEKETFTKYNKVLDRAKITGVEDLEGEYKKVTINNGEITFSFEVPDHWLTETRNSGEVEMNEEELREFLGTDYRGNQITSTEFLTGKRVDYAFLDSDEVQKMSYQELLEVYKALDYGYTDTLPNVSITPGEYIWYTDWSGYQIDMYVMDTTTAQSMIEQTKAREADDLESYDDPILKDMFRLQWFEKEIASKEATCVQHPHEVLETEQGYEYVEKGFKGRPAGIQCYIPINTTDILLIRKQADAGEEHHRKYEHIFKSMIIE